MPRLAPGACVDAQRLTAIDGSVVALPPPNGFVHLQFRRYVGCPVCSLHLREFIRRHTELHAAGITEVALFHSPRASLLAQGAAAPFA